MTRRYMLRFAEVFPDERIVLAMMRQSCDSVAKIVIQTTLPTKELLQAKLHKAIALARKRLENQAGERIAENMAKS